MDKEKNRIANLQRKANKNIIRYQQKQLNHLSDYLRNPVSGSEMEKIVYSYLLSNQFESNIFEQAGRVIKFIVLYFYVQRYKLFIFSSDIYSNIIQKISQKIYYIF